MSANRHPKASIESYKKKLVDMSLEEVQKRAKEGNLRAKQELFRRTGIPNIVTKEMRRDSWERRSEERKQNGQR